MVLGLLPSCAAAVAGHSDLLADGSAAGSLPLFAAAAQLACRSSRLSQAAASRGWLVA